MRSQNMNHLHLLKKIENKLTIMCKHIILNISDICLDKMIEALLQAMINPIGKNQFEIPKEIYENEYVFVNIPYQSVYMLETFDLKIKECIENFEEIEKNANDMMASIKSMRHIMIPELDKLKQQLQKINEEKESLMKGIYMFDIDQERIDCCENLKLQLELFNFELKYIIPEEKKQEKIEEELSLRNKELYLKLFRFRQYQEREWFHEYFGHASDIYQKEGQFDYDKLHCTTDKIQLCFDKYITYIYIGEVIEGTEIPQGIGIKINECGAIYEGYWEEGKLHGRGRFIDVEIFYYTGEFKNGKANGHGTYYKTNGDKYTGDWGDEGGEGEITYADGTIHKGTWELTPNISSH